MEKSSNGNSFSKINTQSAVGVNGTDTAYTWLDQNPVMGDNFYRIRSIGSSGDVKISQVVKVRVGRDNAAITVYPNPVTNRNMVIMFTGMPQGRYQFRLTNARGQLLFTKFISHAGGNATRILSLDKSIAPEISIWR